MHFVDFFVFVFIFLWGGGGDREGGEEEIKQAIDGMEFDDDVDGEDDDDVFEVDEEDEEFSKTRCLFLGRFEVVFSAEKPFSRFLFPFAIF